MTIDKFGIRKSFITGLFLSVANIKTFVFSAAGAARIDNSLSSDKGAFQALALFALIGSITLITPVITYLLAGKKVEFTFQKWKKWLIKNNKILLVIIFVFIGLILIRKGIEIINLNHSL